MGANRIPARPSMDLGFIPKNPSLAPQLDCRKKASHMIKTSLAGMAELPHNPGASLFTISVYQGCLS